MSTQAKTIIEGVQPPPPPKRTTETVKASVLAYIERHNQAWGDPQQAAQEIANEWRIHMDGYELAKALERNHYWNISAQDVEDLDSLGSVIETDESAARKKWAQEWNIQPPHPIGAHIKHKGRKGVIAGVYEHGGATYMVKANGCTQEGRFILVKFEEAELITEGNAA